jgi:hypothetical protein
LFGMTKINTFDALKVSLTLTLLLHPPDYTRDFILYLTSSNTTINMFLV